MPELGELAKRVVLSQLDDGIEFCSVYDRDDECGDLTEDDQRKVWAIADRIYRDLHEALKAPAAEESTNG